MKNYKEKIILWVCYIIAIWFCITLTNENKELRAENKLLQEQARPTLRIYDQSKCECCEQ